MLARISKYFRKYLDLPCVGFESGLAILKIVRRALDTYAVRLLPQCLKRQIERRQYVIQPGIYVAIPKKVAEAKPLGELEDDKSVRLRFPCRLRNGLPKLHEACSSLTAFEAYA